MSEIRFDRKPYNVTYVDLKGDQKTIRRVPPPKLHEMLPTDVVELTTKKNDDFQAGDQFTVKHINARHPNIIQIDDGDGNATFVPYFDLKLEPSGEMAPRDGQTAPHEVPARNRYLLWP